MRRPFLITAVVAVSACAGASQSTPGAAPAAAAPAAPPAGDPARIAYPAGTSQYRLEAVANTVQEVMGQRTEIDATTTMLISSAVMAEGANIAATFTVDSITSTSTAPGNDAAVAAARGRSIRSVFTPLGRPVSMTIPDSTNPVMVQLGEQFRDFFPPLPATIAAGQTWIDTVTGNNNLGEIQVSTTAVRQHRVVGWEGAGTTRAIRIQTTGSYTLTGTGSTQGQELTLAGTGATTAERLVSGTGAYLSSTSTDSSSITVTVVSMGLEIPVRSTRRSTLTRLP